MNRPLMGALATVVLGGAAAASIGVGHASATYAPTHPKPKAQVKAVDFAGTVALSNCSGSVVRMPESAPEDPALVMSNGHCLEEGMPGAGEVVVDQPSDRRFSLLDASGNKKGTLQATKISYATMTDTDVSLYELDATYADIQQKYGISALELSDAHPERGTDIAVVSGYWKKIYECQADDFVYQLREGDWTFKDSVRYTPECKTIGGTSGSPVLDKATGKVVAVNNTGNEDGEKCTVNNPCEVDKDGNGTVRKGINYAQQTFGITKCVGIGNKIDLGLPGCELPKPSAAAAR
jgi:V8-like Glu-specific endopeptidase